MNAFKNLVMMGTLKGRLVSDNGDNDKIFCGTHLLEREPYHRPRVGSPQQRKPTVVTSTQFDNDDAFADVARAMLCRYEHERMSERETINAILTKPEDLRAFLEALDLKYTVVNANESGMEDLAAWEINELVHQIRSIFLPSLKAIWKESVSFDNSGVASNIFAVATRDEPATVQDDEYYLTPPRTPKNLCLSPVSCAYYTSNDGNSMKDGGGCIQTPSKRRRRCFFSETRSDRFVQRSVASSVNPFATGKKFPELRFEFGGKQSLTNTVAPKGNGPVVDYGLGSTSKGTQSFESLQLDGFGPMGGTYGPPTSPIRNVSIELDHSRYANDDPGI